MGKKKKQPPPQKHRRSSSLRRRNRLPVLSFSPSPARAKPPPTLIDVIDKTEIETKADVVLADTETTSPLSEFVETNDESLSPEALKSLLQQKLDLGDDEEALKILKQLISLQPEVSDWKFHAARLTTEIGDTEIRDTDSARTFYDKILKSNPLSFEALFENTLLMDRCGEGDVVIEMLEDALRVSMEDNKEKEVRDVKLIMAQILFRRKNVDEALGLYELLIKEDANDFRPYFCRGVIYTLLV